MEGKWSLKEDNKQVKEREKNVFSKASIHAHYDACCDRIYLSLLSLAGVYIVLLLLNIKGETTM